MPHPSFTLFAAFLLALAFAAVENRSPTERVYVAIRFFAGCLAAVIGGGWVMRLIHG